MINLYQKLVILKNLFVSNETNLKTIYANLRLLMCILLIVIWVKDIYFK